MTRRLPSAPPLLPGLDYVRPLGSGGFADVFLYQQDMPRRQVAVKVLPSGERDPDLLRMFNAEADVLAHLSAHPAIVTVYQAGISADGRPYIVMEYCPGSLAQRYRIERMPVDEVMAIAVRLAGALESAHRAGLIHRDIKPSNILITTFGSAVLADFGISSTLVRSDGDEVLATSIPSAPEVVAEQTGGTVSSEVEPRGHGVFRPWPGTARSSAGSGGRTPRPHAPAHRAGDLRADRARRRARRPAAGARDRDGPRARAPVPHSGRVRRGGARGAARRATRRDPARGARSGVDAGGGDRRFRRHHRARAGAQPGRARGPSRVGGA
ncbi:MAG: serine/threonine-protein kinase [Microbacterium sp.]